MEQAMNYDPLDMEKTIGRDEVREGCSLKEGERLGQYRIIRELGKGGMGEVYEAENAVNHKRVALKVLPRAATGGTFVDRFRVESRVMMDLRHPHIVQVHHAGEENGVFYLTMDLVLGPEGQPLSLEDLLGIRGGQKTGDRSGATGASRPAEAASGKKPGPGDRGTGPEAARKGPLSSKEVAALAMQICDAVSYAHGKQIIHRDLKPMNVLIDEKGGAQVADFGLAKVVGTEYLQTVIQRSISISLSERSIGEAATMPGPGRAGTVASSAQSLLGTYDYMAPEQKAGGEVSPRSDVFALGVIFYRMLTGRKPEGRFKPPSQYGHPKGWDAIVSKCLEPDPSERYADAEALKNVLVPLAGASGVRPASGAGRGLAVAAAAALLAGLAVAAFMLVREKQGAGSVDPPLAARTAQYQAEKMLERMRTLDLGGKFAQSWTNYAAAVAEAGNMVDRKKYAKASEKLRGLTNEFALVLEAGAARTAALAALEQTRDLAGVPGIGGRLAACKAQMDRTQTLIDERKYFEARNEYKEAAEELAQLVPLAELRTAGAAALAALQSLSPEQGFGARLAECSNRLAAADANAGGKRLAEATEGYQALQAELTGLQELDAARSAAVAALGRAQALTPSGGFGARTAGCSNRLAEAGALVAERKYADARTEFEAVSAACAQLLELDPLRKAAADACAKAQLAQAEELATNEWNQARAASMAAAAMSAEGDFGPARDKWQEAATLFARAGDQAKESRDRLRQQNEQAAKNEATERIAADYADYVRLETKAQRTAWLAARVATRKAPWAAAAGLNVPEALVLLAGLHQEGCGVEKSEEEAQALYARAAAGGNAYAQGRLGEMNEAGLGGLKQDLAKAIELYQQAAAAGSAPAQCRLGCLYRDGRGVRRDEAKAVDLFRQSAAGGNLEALAHLGWMRENGLGGLDPDPQAARDCYQKAAAGGIACAFSRLGRMQERGLGGLAPDGAKAMACYRQAAKGGDADGWNLLGLMLEVGKGGLEPDEELAVKCYRQAVSNGNANAKSNLGRMYEEGRGGLPVDLRQAKNLFMQAAAAGDPDGKFNYGRAYEFGWDEPAPDFRKAVEHYVRAADKGHAEAQFRLAQMSEKGLGLPKDCLKARDWYLLAAAQGHLEAQIDLARLYEKGVGMAKDEAEAAKWYEEAAKQGDAECQLAIAVRYENGLGVGRNEAAAVRWYRKAAAQNVVEALYRLGCMYRDGRGVVQNDAEAVKWFQQAVDAGHVHAQRDLAVLQKTMRRKAAKRIRRPSRRAAGA